MYGCPRGLPLPPSLLFSLASSVPSSPKPCPFTFLVCCPLFSIFLALAHCFFLSLFGVLFSPSLSFSLPSINLSLSLSLSFLLDLSPCFVFCSYLLSPRRRPSFPGLSTRARSPNHAGRVPDESSICSSSSLSLFLSASHKRKKDTSGLVRSSRVNVNHLASE